jgi:hypothetical protein
MAFGAVSTSATTSITVRTRRSDFDPAAVATLLERLVAGLPLPHRSPLP